MKDLDGRVAVVTGAGSGIGRATALELAQMGADVVVAELDRAGAERTAAEVRKAGRRALAIPADVTRRADLASMVERAQHELGRIDVLVNNAGGVSARPFLEQSERSWRRHIDLNLVSMLAATSAAVPVMIRGGRGGAIVNVTSIEASRAAPNYAVYAACKAGMVSFTRTMALELAEHRIRVNAIAPDLTVTPGLRGNFTGPVDPSTWILPSTEQQEAFTRYIPLGHEGVDTDCANVAVFLASPMSAYVTGVVVPVDGGTWASSGWVRSRAGKWTLVE